MIESILFGSKQIDFNLDFTTRKSLGITVTHELKVFVKAPIDTPLVKIKERLRKKAPWILKQQSFFLSFYPKTVSKIYVAGETHLYMGKQYRLKLEDTELESVKLKCGFIIVCTSNKENVKHLVKEWYLNNAKSKFHVIAQPLIEQFKKYNVVPDSMILREMPNRWGSCTTKGKIILNPELIKAPKGCIEYVIIHELCHLVHHDHTQKFLDLQSREMPHWENWKLKLEQLLA
jgi:predicted metal-dependent hydrolase